LWRDWRVIFFADTGLLVLRHPVEDIGDLVKAMRELGEEIWYADINVEDIGPDSDVMGLALTWLDFA
jgi:hypothetical protein